MISVDFSSDEGLRPETFATLLITLMRELFKLTFSVNLVSCDSKETKHQTCDETNTVCSPFLVQYEKQHFFFICTCCKQHISKE